MMRIAGTADGRIVRGPHYGYLIIQPYTGEIINDDMLPGKMEKWMGIVTSFFALHFGDFVRWVYFFMGITGAMVFFTGNLLWIESRCKRLRKQVGTVVQSKSSYYLAALTVGVCIGCIAGVGSSFVSAKGLYGDVSQLDQ